MHLLAENISYSYNHFSVFEEVSLTLNAGELIFVSGDNGAGKTTLLKCLAGLKEPDCGQIRTFKEGEISFVGHQNGLKGTLTLAENLEWVAKVCLNSLSDKLNEMLFKVGLEDKHLNQPIETLSQGQKRKAAILAMVLKNKSIWIVDEPLAAIDAQGGQRVEKVFKAHLQNGGSIIMTSHTPMMKPNHTLYLTRQV